MFLIHLRLLYDPPDLPPQHRPLLAPAHRGTLTPRVVAAEISLQGDAAGYAAGALGRRHSSQ